VWAETRRMRAGATANMHRKAAQLLANDQVFIKAHIHDLRQAPGS
jgi:hypothetical protein